MSKLDLKRFTPHQGLLQVIWADVRNYRGLLLWSVLALVSALAAVYLTHLNRELLAQREILLQQRDAIDVEYRHLILEQNTLGEHNRIESLARRELGMQRPQDEQEVLVPWQ